MARPYITFSAAELKDAVEENKNDVLALKALVHEISFRKKAKKTLASHLIKAKEYIEIYKSNEQNASCKIKKTSPVSSNNKTSTNNKKAIGIKPLSTIKKEVHINKQCESNNYKTASYYITENEQPPRKASESTVNIDKIKSISSQNKIKQSESTAQQSTCSLAELNESIQEKSIEKHTNFQSNEKVLINSSQEDKKSKNNIIRKPQSTLNKLPQVWSPEPEITYTVKGLSDAKSNTQKFICTLGGLIWEIRNGANFSKQIQLVNGKKGKAISGEYGFIYSFLYHGDEELFEGARIDFQSGHKKTKGSIVSILQGEPNKTILISLDEDLGDSISQCIITQDEAALLESLQNRLEIENGTADKKMGTPVAMNLELADLLLQGKSKKLNIEGFDSNLENLNNGQKEFAKKAITNRVSFLWGPPGTGKTQTLGSILSFFYEINDRSLICSNTNQAVDQVLLKLCRQMKKQGQMADLEDGKIIRIGRINQAELEDEFKEYVTVDGIAERKGNVITKKIKELEIKRSKSEIRLDDFKSIIDAFDNLEVFKNKQNINNNEINQINNKIEYYIEEDHKFNGRLEKLKLEKINYENKGVLGRAFSRGMDDIDKDFNSTREQKINNKNSIDSLQDDLKKINQKSSQLKEEINKLVHFTKTQNFNAAKNGFDNEETILEEIHLKLDDLKKQIEDIRKTVLSQATIIGATLTKVFLSPSELGKFENIVIDEASMGLLPAVYFAASQSINRCIISGDFRQLPPIVQSKNKAILDILGKDIFAYSGMQEIFEKKINCPHADILREQYRMDEKICDLISEIGYEGELFTSKDRQSTSVIAPKKFKDSVIIIDTSSLYPFTDRDPFGSTSNTVHALLARNIMRDFGNLKDSGNVGYCAPFKAQVKLMRKMIIGESFEGSNTIGTVHTFQGDEKSTMIFDTVNSLGEKHFLNPNLAQETASKSNLLTVAVSRAQHRLIFIANLRYLDSKIPAMGYLRKILFDAQSTGTVVDAKEVVDLVSIEDELKKTKIDIHQLEIPMDSLNSGLINEDVFFPLLKEDLKNAKKYIAIYSGFYTSNRASDLIDILRSKIATGVKIRVIIPPPDKNGSMGEAESNMVFEMLESAGIIVEFRARIHQKSVLIDDDIAWFGSLNPLSFSGGTEESMLRINQDQITGSFAANMAVNRKFAKEDPALMIARELPNCSYCGGKVVFHRGKFGPWVKCQSCKKTENLRGF